MKRIRQAVRQELGVTEGLRLVDLGCGTGALLDDLGVSGAVGVDMDLSVLRIARRRRLDLHLVHADCRCLPLADASVDVVISALHFHHLTAEDRAETLTEIKRVMAPQGRFILVDWARAQTALGRLAFTSVRLVDGFERTRAHATGQLLAPIEAAGFVIEERTRIATAFGSLGLCVAGTRKQ